jgi:hypothetical protein
MRPRRMSRLTLPVVLIAAAAAWPAGVSASGGVVPSGPDPTESSIFVQQAQQDQRSSQTRDVEATQQQPSASDGFDWANAGIAAAVALGLLCVAGTTLLLTTRTRRHTA